MAVSAFGDPLDDDAPAAVPRSPAVSAFGDPIDDEPDQAEQGVLARALSWFGDINREASDTARRLQAEDEAKYGKPADRYPGAGSVLGPTLADPGVSLLKGATGLGQAATGIANIASGGAAGNYLEQQGIDLQAAQEALDRQYTADQQAANRAVDEATGFGGKIGAYASNPSAALQDILESAPGMLAGGVIGRGVAGALPRVLPKIAGVAPVIGGAAGEGVIAAGQAAEEVRRETGGLTAGQALGAVGTGAATGVIGLLGGVLGKRLGIGDLDTQLAGGNGADVARGIVTRVLGGGSVEAIEEMSQGAQEQVAKNAMTGRPLFEGVPEAAGAGAVLGGAMGAGAGARRPHVAADIIQGQSTVQPTVQDPGALPPVTAQDPSQVGTQAQGAPIPGPMQDPNTGAPVGQPSPLQPPAAPPAADPLAPRVPSLDQLAGPQASKVTPFAGSKDVRPLFQSMGMDQQQMDRSLELLAPVEQDIQTARRGVQSWGETGRLAALTGTTIEQLRKHRAGVLFNAEEQVAATRLLRDKTTRVLELSNQLSSGIATEIDQANFLQQLADLRTAQRAVMASRAEIGRALNVMRADVTTMKEATRMLESVGGQQGAKAIADAITTAARVGGVEAANKLARRAGSDLFWTAYKSALLSSPDTHVVNMVSNLFTSALQVPTRALAGAIGTAKRIATGGRAGETRMGEAGYQLAGALEGALNGARGAVESWRTGQDAFGIDANKFEGYRQDLPGQKLWGIPLRLLQSEDSFFKLIGDGMERYSIAYRMASKELAGQGPAAVHKRVQQIIADPPKELLQAGEDAALFQTFNNSAGKVTQAVNNLRLSLPWGTGNLVVPFLRTPANLITYAVKHSPAAPVFKEVRADIAAGGARQETAYARMGIGSLLIGLGALGVAGGTLTGGGPTDDEERKSWLAAGNQPYSIRVNGKWYEYNRVEPMASLVGIAADVASGAQDQAIGLSSMLGAIGRNFTSKTWLQGLSGVMQALTDPDRYAGSWINRSVATLAQPWTVLSHIGRYGDEFQRVPSRDSLLDQLRYRLPGETIGREGLPKKIDPWGAPIREADRQIGRAGPSRITTPSDDPVRIEAGRLGWSPGAPPKQVTDKGVPHTYTAAQHQELSELVGQLVHKGADRLMRHPGWKMLGDDERRQALDKLNTKVRSEVRLAMIPFVHHGKRAAIEQLRKRYNLETK